MTIYKDSKRIVGLSTDFETSGLKAYWKMNEASGNLLNTASAQNSDSTMSADLVPSGTVNHGRTGHISGVDCIGFPTYDQDGNKVTANNSASDYGFMNKVGAKFTACWWARNYSYNNTVDLWSLGGNGGGSDIQVRNHSSGFTVWLSGTEYTSFTHNVGDNDWHFYMLSWDTAGGSNNAQFQLDGTKQTATITTTNTSNSGTPLTIGDVSGNEPQMDIQEFSLWNRVLTDAEIALIYNLGNGAELQNTTIVGSKPTDVQDNSILVEKDTARRYWFSEPTTVTNQDIEWQSSSASSVTISGNTITRTGSDNWTDGIARSVQTISPSRGGGTLIATHSVSHAMVGLSKDPYWTSGNTYANGDYMMYHDNIYELGSLEDTFTAGDDNTLYKITMDSNGLVKYFVDNGSGYSEVYESTVTAGANDEYYVLGTPYGVGDTVSGNITGTITPATWTGNFDVTGLKAYYNFDSIESSTTLTNQATTGDGLSSDANGTIINATLDTTNEKIGTGCYNFDGSGDKVVLGSETTSLNFLTTGSNDWSISFWMKLNSTEPDGNNAILCQGQGSHAGLDILFDDRSGESRDHVLGVRLEGNSGNTAMVLYTSAQFIPKDTDWHHYVITGDVSARTTTAYRDGGNSQSNSSGASGSFPTSLANKLQFGVHPTGGFADLDGKLDDCSLWSRLLTSSEISSLYNSGKGKIVY